MKRERKSFFWEKYLKEWRASGLSQAEYLLGCVKTFHWNRANYPFSDRANCIKINHYDRLMGLLLRKWVNGTLVTLKNRFQYSYPRQHPETNVL